MGRRLLLGWSADKALGKGFIHGGALGKGFVHGGALGKGFVHAGLNCPWTRGGPTPLGAIGGLPIAPEGVRRERPG